MVYNICLFILFFNYGGNKIKKGFISLTLVVFVFLLFGCGVSQATKAPTTQAPTTLTPTTQAVYNITFISNGGSTVDTISSVHGSSVSEPPTPSRDGYRFMGWFSDVNLTQSVEWPYQLLANQTFYAKWNQLVPYGDYLSFLLTNYSFSPFSFITETMLHGYILTSEAKINNVDYSTHFDLSQIPFGGHGEQWAMVLDNLVESEKFFTVFTVVDALTSLSVSAFNNHLDSNPDDTEHYSFLSGIYSVSIAFDDNVISYTNILLKGLSVLWLNHCNL